MIVTATVTKVESQSINCRLENGLPAVIHISRGNENFQPGHVVSGRIDKIENDDTGKFKVRLNNRDDALRSHENYKRDLQDLSSLTFEIPEKDLENKNF